MSNTPEENPHDPWEPGESIDPDIPESAEDVVNLEEENPPSKEATDAFFASGGMEEIIAEQRAAALGEAAEKRAREIYAQQEEKERKHSPHRTELSGEKFDPNTRSWKEMGDAE